MQSFALLALAALGTVSAAPANNIPNQVDIVTGTAYTATFEEADAARLKPPPGVIGANVTYQGLNWSDVNLAIQKPSGTATTFFLIPESPRQYGQIPPLFTDSANFTRTFYPPQGVIRSAKKGEKIQLDGFYFGCSLPGPTPGYFNAPISCNITVTGYGGIGGEGQVLYPDFTPIVGDCASLGSQTLTGYGCARLAYVSAEELSYYGPYDSITFTAPDYLNPNATRLSIFVDDVSYTVHKLPA